MKKKLSFLILFLILLLSFAGCVQNNLNNQKEVIISKMEAVLKDNDKYIYVEFDMINVDSVDLTLIGPEGMRRDSKDNVLKKEKGVYLDIGKIYPGEYEVVATHESNIIGNMKNSFNSSLEITDLSYEIGEEWRFLFIGSLQVNTTGNFFIKVSNVKLEINNKSRSISVNQVLFSNNNITGLNLDFFYDNFQYDKKYDINFKVIDLHGNILDSKNFIIND